MEYVQVIWTAFLTNAPQLIGFSVPFLAAVCNKDISNENWRWTIEVAICAFWAVVLHWQLLTGTTPQNIVPYFLLIFFESEGLFRLYFRNSPLRQKLQGTVAQVEESLPESVSVEASVTQ